MRGSSADSVSARTCSKPRCGRRRSRPHSRGSRRPAARRRCARACASADVVELGADTAAPMLHSHARPSGRRCRDAAANKLRKQSTRPTTRPSASATHVRPRDRSGTVRRRWTSEAALITAVGEVSRVELDESRQRRVRCRSRWSYSSCARRHPDDRQRDRVGGHREHECLLARSALRGARRKGRAHCCGAGRARPHRRFRPS